MGCFDRLSLLRDDVADLRRKVHFHRGFVRVFGDVFAAFAFARLLETIPLTPSGVGFVEAGAAAALISFGGADDASTAAVFLFRGFVYLLEIPVGALAWVVWSLARGWRRPMGTAPVV